MRLVAAPLVVGAVVLLVTGCTVGEEETSTDASALEDVPWVLTSGIDVEGWEESPPSTRFGPRTMGGSTGCNEYGGPYTVDGSTLELHEIAMTLIGCPPPVSGVESAFLALLRRVAAWRVEADELVLLDAQDEELLRFQATSPVGSWVVTGVLRGDAMTTPLAGTELTAELSDEDELSGSAGCNRYRATYTYRADHRGDRGKIRVATPAATRTLCNGPAGVMEQEAAYLEALASAKRYRFLGTTLRLSRSDGTHLVTFARRAP